MSRKNLILMVSMMLGLVSCIKNTVPYPSIVPEIKALISDDAKAVEINTEDREIKIELKETADLSAVNISSVLIEPDNFKTSPSLEGTFDLTKPMEVTISVYEDFVWTIYASQHIERYVKLSNQVGPCFIDEQNHRVIVYVSPKANLRYLSVLEFHLGPDETTSIAEDIFARKDFSTPVSLTVTEKGKTSEWTLFVEKSQSVVNMESVDAWTRVAWVSASGVAENMNGFRYRAAGQEEWITLPQSAIEEDGGQFKACIDGLEPLTSYECVAFSGNDISETVEFTTEAEEQLPNASFETWSKAESSNYYSLFSADSEYKTKWWDSGNAGSTMVGASASICGPDQAEKTDGTTSARLNSRYVVIKFAAGNLFSGEFSGLVGTSGGIVDFGRPFTLRPRKLVLSLKYDCGQIDYVNGHPDNAPVAIGDNDRCNVYIALGDWDYKKYGGSKECPVRVNTTKKETFFDPAGENVIAYGSYVGDKSTDGWIEVEIPLEYKSNSRVPSHIIVSCAASMLGDYFTGSSKSTLWVDNMRLIY